MGKKKGKQMGQVAIHFGSTRNFVNKNFKNGGSHIVDSKLRVTRDTLLIFFNIKESFH